LFFLLAHGALGNWDEIFFLGIAIVFTAFMGMSWWRSREFEIEEEEFFDEEDEQ